MNVKRAFYIVGGALGLVLVYLFQSYLDFYSILFKFSAPETLNYSSYGEIDALSFIVNKAFRYILNDLFSISIIYGLFFEKKYARFAMYVMFFGLLVLLPIYLWLFLSQSEGFSSMLSHLHRIVMNPVLMMLLIPAFFYQRKKQLSEYDQ